VTTTRQIADLFFQLRGAASPAKKLRLVVTAWQTLRGMTPAERRRVAKELGFEGADHLIDRIASDRSGLSPELLKEALHRAGSTDPADVERLMSELRSPETRKGAVERGLKKLETLLVYGTTATEEERLMEHLAVGGNGEESEAEGGHAEEEAPPPSRGAESEMGGKDPTDGAGRGEGVGLPEVRGPGDATAPMTAAAASRPSAGTVTGAEKARPSPSAGGAEPAEAVTSEPPAPPPGPVAKSPAWSEPARTPRPAGQPARRRRPRTGPRVVERAAEPRDDGPARSLGEELGTARTLVTRLRLLREQAGALRSADLNQLALLLQQFPVGWARRRALVALLEAGVPSATDDALTLIAGLESRSARRWCLGTLRRVRGLSNQECLGLAARLGVRVALRPGGRGPSI
jgi:hypothetical protein